MRLASLLIPAIPAGLYTSRFEYTHMVRIRECEERVKRTFIERPGAIRGHTHLADGAEATIAGTLATIVQSYSEPLENYVLPNQEKIIQAVMSVLA